MNKLNFYSEISKTDDEQRLVYGYASTEALDSHGEIISKDAIGGALEDYMKFANIREMHKASAVGVTEQAQLDEKGLYIVAKVVDDAAWAKVKAGVYKGFSIGGKLVEKIGDTITKMKLTEISLVDRPACPEAMIEVFKLEDEPEEVVEKQEEVKVETQEEVIVEKSEPPVEEVKEDKLDVILNLLKSMTEKEIEKVDTDETIAKIADLEANIQKMSEENEDLKKRIKELEDKPAPVKGVARVVEKAEDTGVSVEQSIVKPSTPQEIIKAIQAGRF